MRKIIEHNVETNEIVERNMTNKEFEQWQEVVSKTNLQLEAEAAAAAAKAALLEKLGITEEEAKLLLS